MHHLGVNAGGGNIEADGAFITVEIIVETGGRIDEQRRGHALEIQHGGKRILKGALDQRDGALRFVQPELGRITGWNFGLHSYLHDYIIYFFNIKQVRLPVKAIFGILNKKICMHVKNMPTKMDGGIAVTNANLTPHIACAPEDFT